MKPSMVRREDSHVRSRLVPWDPRSTSPPSHQQELFFLRILLDPVDDNRVKTEYQIEPGARMSENSESETIVIVNKFFARGYKLYVPDKVAPNGRSVSTGRMGRKYG